jgi:HAMP domain-containing protein
MKISTQNLILITPIFLLLALITGLLLFVSERREVRWGLDSEAAGIALTIGEFTDPAALTKLGDGLAGPDGLAAIRQPLERILEFGQARRIELLVLTGGRPRAVLDLGERAGTPGAISDDVLQQALADRVVTRAVPGSAPLLAAYAPIRERTGKVVGLVAVETSLASEVDHRRAVLTRTAAIACGLFVVGCLVALLISRMIGAEIDSLARSARAFASGDYDAQFEVSRIEEVAEVGSTFRIMGSVLRDTTSRSAREVRQFEQSIAEADLAESYAGRFAPPVDEESGGVRLAIDRVGSALGGDFWLACSRLDGHYACLGRVDGPSSLESVMMASAARALLDEGLRNGITVADLLGQASELFPIHCCALLHWRRERGASLEAYWLRAGRPLDRTWIEPAGDRTVVLTTLDEESDRKAARYAAMYTFDAPRTCVNELKRLFGGRAPGGVLAFQGKVM